MNFDTSLNDMVVDILEYMDGNLSVVSHTNKGLVLCNGKHYNRHKFHWTKNVINTLMLLEVYDKREILERMRKAYGKKLKEIEARHKQRLEEMEEKHRMELDMITALQHRHLL